MNGIFAEYGSFNVPLAKHTYAEPGRDASGLRTDGDPTTSDQDLVRVKPFLQFVLFSSAKEKKV